MANFKTAKRPGRFALTLPTKFIRTPHKSIPEKVLKKLHLRSMVHRCDTVYRLPDNVSLFSSCLSHQSYLFSVLCEEKI
jgi:hypothetical protein